MYLFAGAEREADLETALVVQLLAIDSGIELTIENVDILRGGEQHDLLDESRQQHFLDRLSAGYYDFVIAAPRAMAIAGPFSTMMQGRHPYAIATTLGATLGSRAHKS